ncbi:MAG: hypothetical protein KatS3mg081_1467 [Gemmatimonadales bacterium]|nr:hypothetical protein HRbin33_00685 [bacterium HR33]GIW52112.1 MAG: hypothetical protein KatS3mg081_1467 [Gemmatimonadales bacterium]
MRSIIDPLLEALRLTWSQVQLFLPKLLGALVLLTAGWLVARLVRRVVIRLLRWLRVDAAAERAGVEDFLLRGGIRLTAVTLVGQLAYWGVLLIVALAAFNVLGVPIPGSTIEQVAGYLPNVLAAVVIVIFGSLLARFVRGALHTYLNNIGVEGARSISLLAQVAILAFVVTLALNQLRIGGQVLLSAFQLAFGGLCLALALAFGLGGREWAAKLLERTWKLQ